MRLLIVDDNSALAEITAELLRWIDQPAHCIETVTVAGDLKTARHLLPQHDIILCDGQFPVSPDCVSNLEEWGLVFREACRYGIPFVLYSGSAICLDDAREIDIPAIPKPATVETIYAVLTEQLCQGRPAAIIDEPGHQRIVQRGGEA